MLYDSNRRRNDSLFGSLYGPWGDPIPTQPSKSKLRRGRPRSSDVTKAVALNLNGAEWHKISSQRINGYHGLSPEAQMLTAKRLRDAVKKRLKAPAKKSQSHR